MKKENIIIALSIGIVFSVGLWFLNNPGNMDIGKIISFGILAILILFAILTIISRIGSIKSGLTVEDELSKKLVKTAASRSYYFSLYLWLLIMYLDSESVIETDSIIGAGILGMAILFGLHWVILKFVGIKDE
ncbi:MAG: hypothetical protein K9H49_06745 [Bacteroidales bacterium]|nr:hypothetical protein [Bacteroidales bacterium]MCF8390990.1 hypothetical protein [Bacteroidales bacterium]